MSRNYKENIKKYSEYLGMNISTAMGRLRLQILFMLVQKLDMNICFVCNNKIIAPEQLSIEHKKSWYNVNPNHFWDLENIAFSHRKCNRPHIKFKGVKHRLEAPQGKNWCTVCKSYVQSELFSSNKHKPCKSCSSKRNIAYKKKSKMKKLEELCTHKI